MDKIVFLALVAAAAMLPVTNAAAGTAADTAMGNQIGQRLKESGRLHNYRIGVKYEDGVVWLEGSVLNAAQQDTAISLAQQVPGVVHVINHLEIADSAAAAIASAPKGLSAAFNQAVGPATGLEAMPASAAIGQRTASNAVPAGPMTGQAGVRTSNMPVPMGRMRPARRGRHASGLPGAGRRWHGDGADAGGVCSGRIGSRRELRQCPDARLRLAELCVVPELRGIDVSTTVFTDSLAVHWPVLPVSASASGLA